MTNPPHRCSVYFAVATAFVAWISGRCLAQDINLGTDRAAARRSAAFSPGDAALARGKAAMAVGKFMSAHEEFRAAVSLFPKAVGGGRTHDEAMNGFCTS